jgi:hypothetical protein
MTTASRVYTVRAPAKTALLSSALVALAAAPAAAQAVDPGFEAVPAANITEQTLTVPEENFSLRAPGPQWEWLRDKTAKNATGQSYLCRNLRTGERFLVTVTPPGVRAEKYAEDWLARIKAAQEAQGRELVGPRSEPSEVPAPGALRLSTMITAPRTTIYFTGYALGAERVYAFQHYSDAPKESAVFNAFARSFALVNPVAGAGRSPFGGVRTVLAVLAGLALLLLASWVVGRTGKGRRAKPR